MAGTPVGILVLQKGCSAPCDRNIWYRAFILIFTFLAYTSYHLSRKPISIVKNVLHQNCSNATGSLPADFNGSCSWAPFDGDNANELLGSLDYAFLFAYAVGMFISGHIAERMDLRYFLTLGMLGSGLFTCLFGFGRYWRIHSLGYFLAIQIVAGFFQSTGWPSVVTCVANWFGKGKRGFIMGVWNSHTSVGNILGSLIAAYFVDYNWGLSFIVPGIIIGSMGVLVFFFLVPRPEDVQCSLPNHLGTPNSHINRDYLVGEQCEEEVAGLAASENDRLVQASDYGVDVEASKKPDPHKPAEAKAISFCGALRIPGVVEFALCLFFAKLVSYVFLFWLPTYIKNTTRYDPEVSGDLSTLFDVGGIIGGIVAGVMSDYTGARASTCAVMLIVAAPMLFVYESLGNINLSVNIVLLLTCGALVNGPYALITTAVSADLGTHHSLRGSAKALSTVTAIIDGTGSMGAALGPLLTGVISEKANWHSVFYMLIAADMCALMLLGRLVWKETPSRCCRRNPRL